MTEAALILLLANLWAVAVWAGAALLARRSQGLALWPGYWAGAVVIIVAPCLLALAAPPSLVRTLPGDAGALSEAGAAAMRRMSDRIIGWGPEGLILFGEGLATTQQIEAGARTDEPAAPGQAGARDGGETIAAQGLNARHLVLAALALYAAGALVALLRLLAAHVAARRAACLSRSVELPGARHRVLATDAAPPCALGFPAPRILIPDALIARLAPEELDMILRHEAAHIDRRDPETMLFLGLAQAALWPNPAMRALIMRWRLAAEAAADAAVAGGQPLAQRTRYARLLISTLRPGHHIALAAPSAALRLDHKESAKMRLNAILHPRSAIGLRTRAAATTAGVLAITAAAAGFAAAVQPAQTEDAAPASVEPVQLAQAAPQAAPAPAVIPADAVAICVGKDGRMLGQTRVTAAGMFEVETPNDGGACTAAQEAENAAYGFFALRAMLEGGAAYEDYRSAVEAARADDRIALGDERLRAAMAELAGQVMEGGENALWLPVQVWNAPMGAAVGLSPDLQMVCVDGDGAVRGRLSRPWNAAGEPMLIDAESSMDPACQAEMRRISEAVAAGEQPPQFDTGRSRALSLQLAFEFEAAKEAGALPGMAEALGTPDATVQMHRQRIVATMEQLVGEYRDPAAEPNDRRHIALHFGIGRPSGS